MAWILYMDVLKINDQRQKSWATRNCVSYVNHIIHPLIRVNVNHVHFRVRFDLLSEYRLWSPLPRLLLHVHRNGSVISEVSWCHAIVNRLEAVLQSRFVSFRFIMYMPIRPTNIITGYYIQTIYFSEVISVCLSVVSSFNNCIKNIFNVERVRFTFSSVVVFTLHYRLFVCFSRISFCLVLSTMGFRIRVVLVMCSISSNSVRKKYYNVNAVKLHRLTHIQPLTRYTWNLDE